MIPTDAGMTKVFGTSTGSVTDIFGLFGEQTLQ